MNTTAIAQPVVFPLAIVVVLSGVHGVLGVWETCGGMALCRGKPVRGGSE